MAARSPHPCYGGGLIEGCAYATMTDVKIIVMFSVEFLLLIVCCTIQSFFSIKKVHFDPFTKRQRQTLLSIMNSLETLLNRHSTSYKDLYVFSVFSE